jgi:8-amino-3,8-dideoxy-alpha-D-manno-octulosonate transaminase
MPGTEVFGDEERQEVLEVLETGVLFRYGHEEQRGGRWKAKAFEAAVCEFTGAAHAHAVSSGSAAVSCALAAAGIGHGDEVIVPPFTFIATIEAVLMAGALPVFADIDETLCLSVEGIRNALTPRTKAVLLVHMCGAAADLDGILAVCREHDLLLVEDAGQALGATYHGRSVGRFGVAGAFSYDFFKIVTCGEGGVCITDSEDAYRIADTFSDHGHTHVGNNRGMEPHPLLGFNYRISELHAAVGLAQMGKLVSIRQRTLANKQRLKRRLEGIDGVAMRLLPDAEGDSGTFLNFFLPDAASARQTIETLGTHGVGAAYWYENMYHFINQWDHVKELAAPAALAINHLGAPQDYHQLDLPRAQDLMGRLVSIGIRCTWTENELATMEDALSDSVHTVLSA